MTGLSDHLQASLIGPSRQRAAHPSSPNDAVLLVVVTLETDMVLFDTLELSAPWTVRAMPPPTICSTHTASSSERAAASLSRWHHEACEGRNSHLKVTWPSVQVRVSIRFPSSTLYSLHYLTMLCCLWWSRGSPRWRCGITLSCRSHTQVGACLHHLHAPYPTTQSWLVTVTALTQAILTATKAALLTW